MTIPPDPDRLGRILRGDTEAWAEFLAQHRGLVARWLGEQLGPQLAAAAQNSRLLDTCLLRLVAEAATCSAQTDAEFSDWLRPRVAACAEDWSNQLLGRLRAGDAAALGEWVLVHRDLLKRWAKAAGRRLPPVDASDIVQNVLLYLLPRLGTFRGSTWSQFLCWVRAMIRPRFFDPPPLPGAPPDIPDDHSTPSRHGRHKRLEDQVAEARQQLEQALAMLDERSAEAVHLRALHGKPLREVAEVLRCDPIATARLYYQALDALGIAAQAWNDATAFGQDLSRLSEAERSKRRRLAQALAQLPAAWRQAIELRHLEKWPLADIAAYFGSNEEAAGSRIHRGMEALRKELGYSERRSSHGQEPSLE